MENHYQILGIQPSATPEEVKKAYFVMAKKYHPDSGDEDEIQKFHAVAAAYKVLSDKVTRRAYDISEGIEDGPKPIDSEPKFNTIHREKRDSHRDVELKAFHRNRFKNAVVRVIGFTLVMGLIGYIAAFILGGVGVHGLIAGFLGGFSFGVNRHFDMSSFFQLPKKQRHFEMFTWVLFVLGLGYFVWLIGREVFL